MPFTYSITVGIGAGFISYVVLKAARGKAGAVHPLLWVAGRFHAQQILTAAMKLRVTVT